MRIFLKFQDSGRNKFLEFRVRFPWHQSWTEWCQGFGLTFTGFYRFFFGRFDWMMEGFQRSAPAEPWFLPSFVKTQSFVTGRSAHLPEPGRGQDGAWGKTQGEGVYSGAMLLCLQPPCSLPPPPPSPHLHRKSKAPDDSRFPVRALMLMVNMNEYLHKGIFFFSLSSWDATVV